VSYDKLKSDLLCKQKHSTTILSAQLQPILVILCREETLIRYFQKTMIPIDIKLLVLMFGEAEKKWFVLFCVGIKNQIMTIR